MLMFMLMLRRPGATRRLCDAEEMIVVLLLEWLVCVMEFHSTSTKWPHRRFTASLVGIHLHQMAMQKKLTTFCCLYGGCLWLFLHWRMIQDLSQGAVHFLF